MRRESLLFAFVLIALFGISSIAAIPSASAATTPLFKITLIAPGNANIVRRQWAQLVANNLVELGIDARVVFQGWSAVYDRAITPPPSMVGKTYDQGGFDAVFIGYTPGLFSPARLNFLGSPGFFAPYGQNYYLYNSTVSNNLLNTYVTTTNSVIRDQSLEEWQSYIYNQVPPQRFSTRRMLQWLTPPFQDMIGYTSILGRRHSG